MKKQLGQFKRAIVGFLENRQDGVISIPADVKPIPLTKSRTDKEIVYYRLGEGPKKVLFVAAIHGNEIGTVKLAYRLISYLQDPLDNWSDFTFYIIPCLNIDGYENAIAHPDYLNGGRMGRFNSQNVDLNRNFATKSFQSKSVWTHGKNYQEQTEVYCGAAGNSESEIKALTTLIKSEGIQSYIAFHSAGRDVMGNNTEVGQELAHAFSKATGYRFSTLGEWKELKQTGTAKEWCDEHKIAYVEIEASSRWGSDWKNQLPGIKGILRHLRNQTQIK